MQEPSRNKKENDVLNLVISLCLEAFSHQEYDSNKNSIIMLETVAYEESKKEKKGKRVPQGKAIVAKA